MKRDGHSLGILSQRLESGKELSEDEARTIFDLLRTEPDPDRIADVLVAWNRKGYSAGEIATCAEVLRSEVKRVKSAHEVFIDIVGTGGSRAKTFNVSTAAAFVVAGANLPVAKHGNRAASSRTGSADLLTELVVPFSSSAADAAARLNRIGICFMFAPYFHNLTKEIAAARKAVRKPTIFNLLGPVANPAGAPFQLIGIWDGDLAETYGEAVNRLGTKKTWIVHGSDGLDEITLSGTTAVTEVTENGVNRFEISPADFGLKATSLESVYSRTASESAEIVMDVLNSYDDGPARDLVLVNAGAALFVAGFAEDLEDGYWMAAESLDSGDAVAKLRDLSVEKAL